MSVLSVESFAGRIPCLLSVLGIGLVAVALPPRASRAGAAEPGAVPQPEVAADADREESASNTPSAAEPGVEHPETFLEFAVAGGWLMVPIGAASVVGLAFLLERLITTRRRRVLPSPLVQSLQGLMGDRPVDTNRVRALCDSYPSSAATLVRTAVDRLGQNRDEIEHAVNSVAQREIHGLRRYVRLFAIIASVAPLLGLLGTVTGMIQAFRQVAEEGLGGGQGLAPGIYTALITTAAGLVVAIPALMTYHWIMSRVDNYVHELDVLLEDCINSWIGPAVAPVAAASTEAR